jgi:hypothetical protein
MRIERARAERIRLLYGVNPWSPDKPRNASGKEAEFNRETQDDCLSKKYVQPT